ncbi:hypothetical protein JVU11DRAFT_10487 [Chiua virens]|nr:hypothetical protein JVU11DRAFT_10487 [Chiua virens]
MGLANWFLGEISPLPTLVVLKPTAPIISYNIESIFLGQLGDQQINTPTILLWATITALNLYVGALICLRLYTAQARTHRVLSDSLGKSVAILLVECGALMTAIGIGMTVLYSTKYAYAASSLGIATEIAVASQLLVTARHGMETQGQAILPQHEDGAVDMEVEPRHSRCTRIPRKNEKCSFTPLDTEDC